MTYLLVFHAEELNIYNWRASEASETLSGVYKFKLVQYIYIHVWRYVCHNSSSCHACILWVELGHCHFIYVPAILNLITNGNGTGTKKFLKWNRVLGYEFSIQSSVYSAASKPILHLNTVYCKFLLYVSVEIDPFSWL